MTFGTRQAQSFHGRLPRACHLPVTVSRTESSLWVDWSGGFVPWHLSCESIAQHENAPMSPEARVFFPAETQPFVLGCIKMNCPDDDQQLLDKLLSPTCVEMSTNLSPAKPTRVCSQSLVDPHQATVATRQGRDVTEWYRERYRGVVAAEKHGGEVLMLFDEGESYGVNRQTLAFPDTDREVLVHSWVDHVPKSRIDPTRPLFGQWAG